VFLRNQFLHLRSRFPKFPDPPPLEPDHTYRWAEQKGPAPEKRVLIYLTP